MSFGLRRVALVASALGAVALLVAATSFALFSGRANAQNNTFSAGTVTLSQTAGTACTVTALAPGDTDTCTYTVTYGGSLAAVVLLDVTATSSAGAPGTEALLDGTQGINPCNTVTEDTYDCGLQVSIQDSQASPNTYSLGTVTCTGNAPNASPCNSSDLNQGVAYAPGGGDFSTTFTTTAYLPLGAENEYQGGSATITLTAHAVQAAHNPNALWTPFDDAVWNPTAGPGGTPGLITTSAPDVNAPYGVTDGGTQLLDLPTTTPADLTALSFEYYSNVSGPSGGSPRLVVQFSNGDNSQLRPGDLVANAWTTVHGISGNSSTWDQSGPDTGGCVTYNATWTDVLTCNGSASITGIYVVNDSGWLFRSGEQIVLDNVTVNGDVLNGPGLY